MTTLADQVTAVLAELDPERQRELLQYATYLRNAQATADPKQVRFYICPVCFSVSGDPMECHGRAMVSCNAGNPDDCKPLMDEDGALKSPAPRWFVRAVTPRQA